MGIQETASTITREYIGVISIDDFEYEAHVIYIHDFDHQEVTVKSIDFEVFDGAMARLHESKHSIVEDLILKGALFND